MMARKALALARMRSREGGLASLLNRACTGRGPDRR
jgi:hypothetical protein